MTRRIAYGLRTFQVNFLVERDFFYFLLRSDNELLVSEIQKVGIKDFVSEIKGEGKLP